MHLGPFYLDTKELFLIVAALLIALAIYFGWPLWLFNSQSLLVLVIIMLVVKGLLPAIHNENFFVLSLTSLLLLLYLPLFQVLLFYSLSFALLKILKVI
ncbi:hypothetical protein A2313_04030 [Candidatus Roizmanbacteria bacterium RIFOXYB2_FULL_41_10]|uniref:Uncharacterized protein n=1 Tax=Candidatus Roizmanbacteria bacterium RIFOXYA1_FULL_41_12 TaxID=1802082 RepID=A0A1F7KFF4_9BACT|nr:MAG: hypothetical protein A2377_03440 [Candidatus Roizmanbacteria bacterium RIFOXYB1_FULL_41_27]OGK66579.1 MAG: hypothetical protein A2209_01120 [Candidatus Roizmanbacteria bacterium RIFOXYA1_FULL_41_12]OGK71752.1 MAG: hypothetical protein A2313_04030 [Candidatus Roizmanbacteria bacterium RIFOXYB2_FULL_41_10]OGK72470.1 MAG: hypothetical protein A2403_03970 [Candidatus Roizmanbacteria bacterium RIFOXYC1_FULL_41_16]OGK75403.1 MAG: hypothetical protein A2459_01615 [Candidatus Roizmanbacteria ba